VVAILALALTSLGGGTSPAPSSPAASPSTAVQASATADSGAIEPLLAYVRREYPEIYDADRSPSTDDDLTSSKLDFILSGGSSTDSAANARLLAQLTTVILNVSSKALGQATDGDPICPNGLTDLSAVDGATALFGEARPTIATVIANIIGSWNGQLTNDGRNWTFRYSEPNLKTALSVLEGINGGRLVTSSGC
jgi:DNA-binding transcriptional LysR family regulator